MRRFVSESKFGFTLNEEASMMGENAPCQPENVSCELPPFTEPTVLVFLAYRSLWLLER